MNTEWVACGTRREDMERSRAWTGRFFHGLLRDVRIYRKALSAKEVRALAKDGGVKSGNTNETQQ